MSEFDDAVKEAAKLAVQKHNIETQLDLVEEKIHQVFQVMDKSFEHGKKCQVKHGERTIDLCFSISMDGTHACRIDVHDGEKRVGFTWLY